MVRTPIASHKTKAHPVEESNGNDASLTTLAGGIVRVALEPEDFIITHLLFSHTKIHANLSRRAEAK